MVLSLALPSVKEYTCIIVLNVKCRVPYRLGVDFIKIVLSAITFNLNLFLRPCESKLDRRYNSGPCKD